MHVADRRHGLDVVATLRARGRHRRRGAARRPAPRRGKGDTGLVAAGRVLARAGVRRVGLARRPGWLPGMRAGARAARGPRRDARRELAEAAGCSPRTVELIRHQDGAGRPGGRPAPAARRRGELMTRRPARSASPSVAFGDGPPAGGGDARRGSPTFEGPLGAAARADRGAPARRADGPARRARRRVPRRARHARGRPARQRERRSSRSPAS